LGKLVLAVLGPSVANTGALPGHLDFSRRI
jgi:hypothetical protein